MIKLSARERSSSRRAEELITEWLDPDTLRQCLALFASSIEKIRQVTPPCWGVTLCPNGQALVRLTVGMVHICDLNRDEIALTLHGPSQDAAVLAPYLRGDFLSELRWCSGDKSAPRPSGPLFPSVPTAVWCRFRSREIDSVWPLARDSYIRMIDLAAKSPLSPTVRRSHSPGVIEYLNASFPEGLPAL